MPISRMLKNPENQNPLFWSSQQKSQKWPKLFEIFKINLYPEVHVFGKKYQISPFLEVVTFFSLFLGFWSCGKLTFGISNTRKITFGILISGF